MAGTAEVEVWLVTDRFLDHPQLKWYYGMLQGVRPWGPVTSRLLVAQNLPGLCPELRDG